jgi:cytochrome bd-type quinol oxidase subunit 1
MQDVDMYGKARMFSQWKYPAKKHAANQYFHVLISSLVNTGFIVSAVVSY